jgi:hypothetical protein
MALWYLPATPVEPGIYHGMGVQFCFLTRSNNDLSGQFDAVRMNGNVPFFSLDSHANGVSNSSVFHQGAILHVFYYGDAGTASFCPTKSA